MIFFAYFSRIVKIYITKLIPYIWVTEVRSKMLTPLETTGGNSFLLERFEKMLFKLYAGLFTFHWRIQISFHGVYDSSRGVQKSFQGVYTSTAGIQISFLGVYSSTTGIRISFQEVNNSTGGVHISIHGVYNTIGGIQISI